MDTNHELMERILDMGEKRRLDRTPIHLREKEFNNKLIKIAQKYDIADFKIFYGNNRCHTYQESKVVEHTSFEKVKVDLNGASVEYMRDLADKRVLDKFKKEVSDLCELYGYKRFHLIFDGFRIFSSNWTEAKFVRKF